MSADEIRNALDAGDAAGRRPFDFFAPPDDFDHGAEFQPEPPRPLPDIIRDGRYVRARKDAAWTALLISMLCFATAQLPFIQELSWYLLPLGYLDWIGAFFLALAVCLWLRNFAVPGHLALVRRGYPLVGKVRKVDLKPGGFGDYQNGRFVAEVEYKHPESGALQRGSVTSPDVFMLNDGSTMEPGVAPGDYVTLAYLPGRVKATLQLYGWLGLNADLDFVRKDGYPLQPHSPIRVLLAVTGFTVLCWVLLGFLYVFERYMPFDDDSNWSPYLIGIGLASLPFAVVMFRRVDRDGATAFGVVKRYLFAGFWSFIGGLIVGGMVVGFLNGYFDHSPTQLEPVRIVQLWNKTHDFILRTYELQYSPIPAGEPKKKIVDFETLSMFEPGSLGVMDVGSGWLGMRWLRGFHPVEWVAVDEDEKAVLPGEIEYRMPDQPESIRIAPQVQIGETAALPPPPAMLPELRARMIATLTNTFKATVIEPGDPK
jgi:hypothetical protein